MEDMPSFERLKHKKRAKTPNSQQKNLRHKKRKGRHGPEGA